MGSVKRHRPELSAANVGNSVVSRQPFVDERVIGVQEIHDVAVFVEDAADKQFHFLSESRLQAIVEVREKNGVRIDLVEIAHAQPLKREVRDQRFGPRIGEHAAHLLFQHDRIAQSSFHCEIEQRLVRDLLHRKNDNRDASSRLLIL